MSKKPLQKPKEKPEEDHFVRKVPIRFLCEEDQGFLDSQSRMANKLANLLIQEIRDTYWLLNHGYGLGWLNEERESQLLRSIHNAYEFRNKVVEIKKKHPFFTKAHSSVLKNVALDVHQSLVNKREGRAKRIKFKSWKRQWTSLEYEEKGKGWKILENPGRQSDLRISFGKGANGKQMSITVGLEGNPHSLGKARSCRIVKDAGKYYAIFGFKRKPKAAKVPRHHKKLAYLDPNIKNFAYGLDLEGNAFEIANPCKSLEKRIDKLKSKRDRCQKQTPVWIDEAGLDGVVRTSFRSSRRYFKLEQAVNRLQDKLREKRKHFIYSVINQLFSRYDEVVVGDYVPEACDHGMGPAMNRALNNRAMHGSFKAALLHGAKKRGKRAAVQDERGSTRTCHACLKVVEEGIHPKIRVWRCRGCQVVHLRDENSDQNGLRVYGENQGPSRNLFLPRSGHPVVVLARCDWEFLPDGGFMVRQRKNPLPASNANGTSGPVSMCSQVAGGNPVGCAPGQNRCQNPL